jgi:hypothetical protein
MSKYGISKSEGLYYLDYIMNNKIFTDIDDTWRIVIDNKGYFLYETYYDGKDFCGIYANALFDNVYMMLDPKDYPHENVFNTMRVFYRTFDYFANINKKDGLLFHSYYYLNPQSKVLEPCISSQCLQQTLGDNIMVCIAAARFCLKYLNHGYTPKLHKMLIYLIKSINGLKCDVVIKGKTNIKGYKSKLTDVSGVITEDMIILYSLLIMVQLIPQVYDQITKIIEEMIINTKNFVKNMYYDTDPPVSAYYFGTNNNCIDINTTIKQPCLPMIWAMLAGVDNNKPRQTKSLTFVNDFYMISSTVKVPGGIKPSYADICPVLEFTGTFLCSLIEYKKVFGNELPFVNSKNINDTYSFIYNQVKNKEAIQATYGIQECDAGQGLIFFSKPELSSLLYGILSLVTLRDNNINVFQYLPIKYSKLVPLDSIITISSKEKEGEKKIYVQKIIIVILLIIIILYFLFKLFLKINRINI